MDLDCSKTGININGNFWVTSVLVMACHGIALIAAEARIMLEQLHKALKKESLRMYLPKTIDKSRDEYHRVQGIKIGDTIIERADKLHLPWSQVEIWSVKAGKNWQQVTMNWSKWKEEGEDCIQQWILNGWWRRRRKSNGSFEMEDNQGGLHPAVETNMLRKKKNGGNGRITSLVQ